jgi:hypothetical protein
MHYTTYKYIVFKKIKGKSNANGIIIFNGEILELTLNNFQLIQKNSPDHRVLMLMCFFMFFLIGIDFLIFFNSHIHTYILTYIWAT